MLIQRFLLWAPPLISGGPLTVMDKLTLFEAYALVWMHCIALPGHVKALRPLVMPVSGCHGGPLDYVEGVQSLVT